MSITTDNAQQPSPQGPAGSKPVKKGKKPAPKWMKFVPILLVILSVCLLLYPVLATQHNNARQEERAEKYHTYVENLSPDEKKAKLDSAREYNRTHLGGPILDPWLARVAKNNAPYTDYLHELSGGPNDVMARIVIPSIQVNLPIYHGTDEKTLQEGVGHLYGSALPVGGEGTHSVLTGHTGLGTSTLFDHLDKVKMNDSFYIEVMGEQEKYQVDQIKVVLPSETDLLQPVKGQEYVTLVTCTPYGVNSHRLLVRGHRVPLDENAQKDLQTKNSRWSAWMWGFIIAVGILILGLLWALLSEWRRKRKRQQ